MATTASFLFLAAPLTPKTRTRHLPLPFAATNSAPQPAKPTTRRTRKKPPTPKPKSPVRRSEKTPPQEQQNIVLPSNDEVVADDGDEEIPYEWPPLVCCFGSAKLDFIPTVRVSEFQKHPDMYSTWKELQWDPPEFARAPGGPACNVAVAHARLGGRAAFIGKVGDDEFGNELVYQLNSERVQTRGVKIDENVVTAATRMRVGFFGEEDGEEKKKRLVAETVKCCAEDSFMGDEINVDVLKEARVLHFNSEALITTSMRSALFRAIELAKKSGSKVFFDLNLPLPLWRSREATWELIREAWNEADHIEVSRQELEFLLDEEHYTWKRNYKNQYYAESYDQMRKIRNYNRCSMEEIAPIWHDGIKMLFVTDGTLRIHYYTPRFDGSVIGTEDVLITPFTCDRTGSGDAVVAALIRKLTTCPEMYEDQDKLERHLRFVIAAGIIAQWTIGSTKGLPTENATQNLKEQVYIPALW